MQIYHNTYIYISIYGSLYGNASNESPSPRPAAKKRMLRMHRGASRLRLSSFLKPWQRVVGAKCHVGCLNSWKMNGFFEPKKWKFDWKMMFRISSLG